MWTERRAAARRMNGDAPSNPAEVLSGKSQLFSQLPQAAQVGPFSTADLFTAAARPDEPYGAPSGQAALPGWISSLVLPYGTARSVHLAKNPDAPLVIHVQDAHEIEEAQKNTASMIEGFSGRAGVPLVGLEGAEGAFDFAPYRAYPDKEVTRQIAGYFLKTGYLGGTEYAAITLPKPPLVWGVESFDLYLANIKATQDAAKLKPAVETWLEDLETRTEPLKAQIYSDDLKAFDKHYRAYNEQREGLGDYVSALFSLASAGAKASCPDLQTLLKALAAEKSLDFKRVEKERGQLVEALVHKLPKADLNVLAQKSLDYRTGRIGYAGFHQSLKDLCRTHGVSLDSFEQFNAYVDYLLLADRIDRNALMVELEGLEQSVPAALARTPEQKSLVASVRHLAVLKKLADHQMTPADWSYYSANQADIRDLPRRLASLPGATGSEPAAAPSLTPFEDFCRLALQRNQAMVSGLLDKMKKENAKAAFLVAGGFHTDGMTALLREKGASYVVVTPKITEVPKENHSLDIFSREQVPLEKLFAGERITLVSERLTAVKGEVKNGLPVRAEAAVRCRLVDELFDAFEALAVIAGDPARAEGNGSCAVHRKTYTVTAVADGSGTPRDLASKTALAQFTIVKNGVTYLFRLDAEAASVFGALEGSVEALQAHIQAFVHELAFSREEEQKPSSLPARPARPLPGAEDAGAAKTVSIPLLKINALPGYVDMQGRPIVQDTYLYASMERIIQQYDPSARFIFSPEGNEGLKISLHVSPELAGKQAGLKALFMKTLSQIYRGPDHRLHDTAFNKDLAVALAVAPLGLPVKHTVVLAPDALPGLQDMRGRPIIRDQYVMAQMEEVLRLYDPSMGFEYAPAKILGGGAGITIVLKNTLDTAKEEAVRGAILVTLNDLYGRGSFSRELFNQQVAAALGIGPRSLIPDRKDEALLFLAEVGALPGYEDMHRRPIIRDTYLFDDMERIIRQYDPKARFTFTPADRRIAIGLRVSAATEKSGGNKLRAAIGQTLNAVYSGATPYLDDVQFSQLIARALGMGLLDLPARRALVLTPDAIPGLKDMQGRPIIRDQQVMAEMEEVLRRYNKDMGFDYAPVVIPGPRGGEAGISIVLRHPYDMTREIRLRNAIVSTLGLLYGSGVFSAELFNQAVSKALGRVPLAGEEDSPAPGTRKLWRPVIEEAKYTLGWGAVPSSAAIAVLTYFCGLDFAWHVVIIAAGGLASVLGTSAYSAFLRHRRYIVSDRRILFRRFVGYRTVSALTLMTVYVSLIALQTMGMPAGAETPPFVAVAKALGWAAGLSWLVATTWHLADNGFLPSVFGGPATVAGQEDEEPGKAESTGPSPEVNVAQEARPEPGLRTVIKRTDGKPLLIQDAESRAQILARIRRFLIDRPAESVFKDYTEYEFSLRGIARLAEQKAAVVEAARKDVDRLLATAIVGNRMTALAGFHAEGRSLVGELAKAGRDVRPDLGVPDYASVTQLHAADLKLALMLLLRDAMRAGGQNLFGTAQESADAYYERMKERFSLLDAQEKAQELLSWFNHRHDLPIGGSTGRGVIMEASIGMVHGSERLTAQEQTGCLQVIRTIRLLPLMDESKDRAAFNIIDRDGRIPQGGADQALRDLVREAARTMRQDPEELLAILENNKAKVESRVVAGRQKINAETILKMWPTVKRLDIFALDADNWDVSDQLLQNEIVHLMVMLAGDALCDAKKEMGQELERVNYVRLQA